MIDSKNHVILDGVAYRLAESAEGQHHNVRGEPLRPPNGVTVQGESQQKFQPRPEVLLWNWTNWDEGEGRRTLKFGESGRSWQLNGVRAFQKPGKLMPGWYIEETQDSTGASDFAVETVLATGRSVLRAFARAAANGYLWDGTKWGAATAIVGPAGGFDSAVGDEDAYYLIENGVNDVWHYDATTATKLSDTLIGTTNREIEQLSDYVYVYRPASATVWEIPKTLTGAPHTPTVIDNWTENGLSPGDGQNFMTALDGRIYVVVVQVDKTMVREITPTSAAGTGFGSEIARIQGFRCESLWSHSGTLFLLGRYEDEDSATERTVLYLTPGGEYGSLGAIREGDNMLRAAGGAGRMLDHFFVTRRRASGEAGHSLWQVDSVSGGIACLGYDESGGVDAEDPQAPVTFKGEVYWTVKESSGTDRILRGRADQYMSNGSAISPEHDFDLVSEKFLSSLVLSCEPLPADWTVYVDYQINNDGTWTNAITYTTDSGTGTKQAITTDSSTVEFKRLQMRVRFEYTGAGVPTSGPVVLGVEARAVVATKVKVFQIMLDLSTDQSAGKQSKSGANKVDLFLATAAKATSVDYQDGYTSPRSGEFDQYDVFVDEYNVVLDRPGEGIAAVTLREVI